MIDKRPALIVRCVDVADVIAAVDYARDQQPADGDSRRRTQRRRLGTCDDGLVIDLSPMRGVRVDPAERTVRVDAGCVWGDVDHATHPFGLAVPCGFISSTGVGGLTLGGGIGYLTRQYGLTIDNLLSADVVLADGSVVTADETSNRRSVLGAARRRRQLRRRDVVRIPCASGEDGVRRTDVLAARADGGGDEGLPDVHSRRAGVRERLLRVSDHSAGADVSRAPASQEGVRRDLGCHGSGGRGRRRRRKPMRSRRQAGCSIIRRRCRCPCVNSLFDGLYPPGLQWYWRADFVKELSDEAIARHVEHGAALPTMHSTMHLYAIDGAAHRVGQNDTAFSYRDANWAEVIVGVDPDPANAAQITKWCKDYFDALHPYSAGGAYVNFMMDEGQERVQVVVPGQLRSARRDQVQVRSDESVPGESESSSSRTPV